MARGKRYTNEDRQTAIAVCYRVKGNVDKAARIVGIPARTLLEWWEERESAVITVAESENAKARALAFIRDYKKRALTRQMQAEQYAIIVEMAKKRDKANYRDLAVTLGILTDKIGQLSGLPDSVLDSLPEILRYLVLLSITPGDYFRALLLSLEDAYKARQQAESSAPFTIPHDEDETVVEGVVTGRGLSNASHPIGKRDTLIDPNEDSGA
jgi:transposase-like protein